MPMKYRVTGWPPVNGAVKADYPNFESRSEAEKFVEAAKHDHPDWRFEIEELPVQE